MTAKDIKVGDWVSSKGFSKYYNKDVIAIFRITKKSKIKDGYELWYDYGVILDDNTVKCLDWRKTRTTICLEDKKFSYLTDKQIDLITNLVKPFTEIKRPWYKKLFR